MFTIITTLNPLTGGETSEDHKWVKGMPLSYYVGHTGKCVIEWNQSLIDLPLEEVYPARREVYRIAFIPEGVDRQEWRLIGYTVMTGVSMIPGWGPYAAYVGANLINTFLQDKKPNVDQSPSYAWRHMASPAAAFGSAMPIVYGKTRVRPVLKNRYVEVDGDKQRLYALYGVTGHLVDETFYNRWEPFTRYIPGDVVRPIATADEPGKTYRCTRAAINDLYNDKRFWEVGPGTASFAGDIYINGRASGDYGGDVRIETRPGLAEQAIIGDFDVTYVNRTMSAALYRALVPQINKGTKGINLRRLATPGWIFYSTHYLTFQGITHKIDNDSINGGTGVRYLVWKPDIKTNRYFVETVAPTVDGEYLIATYNINVSGEWVTKPVFTVDAGPVEEDWFYPTNQITNAHDIKLYFELPNGLYDINKEGAIKSATCEIFAQYKATDSSKWLNFSLFNLGKTGTPGAPYPNGTISGRFSRKRTIAFSVSLAAVPVDPDEYLDTSKIYEIRTVAFSLSVVNLVNAASLVYGAENAEGIWPGFTYPGEALIGVRALASGQVNSDLDVQVDVERSKVWVWNARLAADNKWVEADAGNHAWACYDILVQGFYNASSARIHPAYPEPNIKGNTWTNADGTFEAQAEAIYGCGIDPLRIDYESFRTWAENINTIGYTLNIVFDTFMSAWDAIIRISQEGRGMVYPIGATIYAFTDKAEDVSQLFTMGTIMKGTFVQKYVESKQQINLIEADYFDAGNNYEKTRIDTRKSDWDSSRDVSVPSKVTLYGTDNFNQAQSIIRFMLMGTELLDNVMAFEIDIDSLAARVGEVIGVQHQITDAEVGCGGRVVSASTGAPNDIAVIDQLFTLEAGVTYTMEVKHGDGTLETNTIFVQGVDTTTASMGFGTPWSTLPAQYKPFTIYKATIGVKKYRITGISRTTELMRTLSVVQYDEALYDSWVPGDASVAVEPGEFTSFKVAVGGDTVETLALLLNAASNLQLQEIISRNNVTGKYESSVIATWDTENGEPRGKWEVWFRDVDASDIDWQGVWLIGDTYAYGDKVEHDGYTYISLIDDNTGITPVLSGRVI